ncbi:alpha/beta hydrolase-fold protein [Thalassotalea nanhaiensis]|uniref:Alpha/beta hydrolase-fold protein n=1 Tax=Thalassotalea nanhaiensis TaxID=3065648 RepID=A0ABY9TIN5_9GAMM|nr:alpha/beta hydrolase-fold protein [Colwelliaceae bacterium SQ345]
MNRWLSLLLVAITFNCLASDPIPVVHKGTIERIEPFKSKLIGSRYIDVWLPPGYSENSKYDVLYMHDGRMLFDANITWNKQEWMVDEVAGSLIEQQKVRPFIVVAIPNGVKNRHSEFFPQQPFEKLSKQQQAQMYQLERSADLPLFNTKVYSDKYLEFIVTEVVPFIDANYSVKKGGKHRYLAGSSMGGLISWYGLMQYPNEFAGAICMSTHWPGAFAKDKILFQQFLNYIKVKLPTLTDHKIYFDHGDATLDAMYPVLQQQVDTLFTQEYPKQQWQSLFFKGENHSEQAWSKRLHIPLEFIFALHPEISAQ